LALFSPQPLPFYLLQNNALYIFTLIFISVSIFVLGLLSAFGQQKQTQQKEERENFTKSI
jgi:hypothetical protein